MSLIVINTKGLYDNFMIYEDGVDKFRENPIAISKMQLSSDKVSFIKNYLTLIMSTSIVSETTKLYIRCHSDRAIKPSFEAIIEDRKKKGIKPDLNINTCLSKVTYDTKKLLQYFPNDMIEKIKNVNTHNLSVYKDNLYKALAKYSPEKELSDKLVIKLPMTGIHGELTDSEFNGLLKLIEPYTKSYVEQLIKSMPEKYLQYFNYLIYVENKNGIDKERMSKLEKMLAGEKVETFKGEEIKAEGEELSQQEIEINFNNSDEEVIDLDYSPEEFVDKTSRMSKEKGYYVDGNGLGKISTRDWNIK